MKVVTVTLWIVFACLLFIIKIAFLPKLLKHGKQYDERPCGVQIKKKLIVQLICGLKINTQTKGIEYIIKLFSTKNWKNVAMNI